MARTNTGSWRLLLRMRGSPGPRRLALLRKLLAVVLLIVAVIAAFGPAPALGDRTTPVLVAARDLSPGTTLRPPDLRVARLPEPARPGGALTSPAHAAGRVLAGAARAGEPITDVRLTGQANTALTARGSASVPVRLADPAIAELLRPGTHVDVVALDEQATAHQVLARDATVITVLAARGGMGTGTSPDGGRLVLIALPEDTATRVAAVSLARSMTVTLRES